jgi:type I restriction modification system, site specificity determination subunit, hsdS_1
MNAIKRAPQLRFPEFAGEWREKRLGEIFLFKRTNSLSRAQLDIHGVVKNIHYGDIHTKFPTVLDSTRDDISYIRSSVGDNVGDFLYDGDLVVADASEDYNDIGKTVEISGVDNNEVKIVAGLHTLALSPYSNYANGFMGYLFKTESVHRQMVRVATGVSVLGLSKSNVSDMCLLVPPLEEQQKIAAFLATVDKRVALLERKVQQLETYKHGVMQQLFSQQLRFTRPDGSHFPAWQEKRLGEITVNKPSTITAGQLSDSFEGYAVYGASGIAGYVKSFQHEQPYTAVVKDGAGAGRLLWCEGETSVLSTLTVLLSRQGIDAGYLHYVLQGIDFSKYITGSTIPHVYYRDFSKAKLKVPIFEEQQKITTFLSALDEKIALTRQQLDKTKQFKKGLLQRMFV